MEYITPIFVRSPGGRSGTSLLMEMLGRSDEVVFDKKHPYESRVFSYFFRLSQLPFLDKNHEVKWENDSLVRGAQNVMGPLPIKPSFFEVGDFARDELIKSIWQCVSSLALKSNSSAKYYAEKVPHDILGLIYGVIEFKSLMLVRDPRDELVSIMSFNQKRGAAGFGWRDGEDFDDFFKRFLIQRKRYFSLVRSNPYDGVVVKYEDMVYNRGCVLNSISKYLGVDLAGDMGEEGDIVFEHMTSESPSKSIGKWKEYLEGSVVEAFNDELGEDLVRFEYT